MSKNAIVWIIIVLVVGGGAWYFSSRQNTTLPSDTVSNTASPEASSDVAPVPQTVTVTYNGTSFSPSMVTVHTGDTVTFVDSSSNPMWVASGAHPAHIIYDGTDRAAHCAASYTGPAPFDECQALTESYSFTFTKTGTWPFHDHVNASATGKVVVE